MTTPSGGNEVFRPTPIQFDTTYDVTKMRRLALDVNNVSNRLAALTVTTSNATLPSGGTPGQVLTKTLSGNAWANPQTPTTFPYGQLTGVPTVFSPSQHLIANTTGLGPAHSIIAAGPGQVLKASGTSAASMAFLNYADLGDVDLTNLQGGYVPAWNSSANKWQMVAPGVITGTLGYVLTGQGLASPPLFLPVPLPTFPASGLGGAQWGIYPQNVVPNRNFAGKPQYASLNIPALADSILGGDNAWHALSDVEISWVQLSDVPAQIPAPVGSPAALAPFLRSDNTWSSLRPSDHGAGTPQYGLYPHSSGPRLALSGRALRQLNLPVALDSVLTGGGRWTAISDVNLSWSQISDIPYGAPVRTAAVTGLPATGASLAQVNAALVQVIKDLGAFRLYAA